MKRFFSLLLTLVLSLGCVATAATAASQEFTDVTAGDYFYDPVQWAVEKEITKGVTPTRFAPNQFCTRAQAVTMLWRAAGSPTEKEENPFTDVKTGDYFYHAVAWAVKNNITKGVAPTRFAPHQFCTRGQIMTFIWRAKGCPQASQLSTAFSDVDAKDYYAAPIAWAVENNITKGVTPTLFAPDHTCTRGQIVTFLYRAEQLKPTEPTPTEPTPTEPAPTEPAPTEPDPTEPDPTEPDPTPHVHKFVLSLECPATCTETGYRVYICKLCGESYREDIPMIDHTYDAGTPVPGTCIAPEKMVYTCKVCGHIHEEVTGDYGTHEYGITHESPATCVIDGYRQYTCKYCLDTYTETIPAEGHDYELTEKIQPSCTEEGRLIYTCTKCGNEKFEFYADALGHDCHWVITTPATDSSEGEQSCVCKTCGKVLTTQSLPRFSQNTQDYEIDMGGGETKTVRGFYNPDYEQQVFEMLNAYRVENGKKPLKQLSRIVEGAAIRGAEQAVSYSHTRPNGAPFLTVCSYARAENLALANPTPESAMQAWKDSPGHNENMLRPQFYKVGISCFFEEHVDSDGHKSYIPHWVQLFG